MRVACYLVVEPLYGAYGDKITGAKVVGIRQRKPGTLENEARALQVHINLPDGFFDPPQAFIDDIEGSHASVTAEAEAGAWPTGVPDDSVTMR